MANIKGLSDLNGDDDRDDDRKHNDYYAGGEKRCADAASAPGPSASRSCVPDAPSGLPAPHSGQLLRGAPEDEARREGAGERRGRVRDLTPLRTALHSGLRLSREPSPCTRTHPAHAPTGR
jgi:hypothetical protein